MGSIGNLPWQENAGTPYGASESDIDLFAIAKGIYTYIEQRQQTDTEQKIDQALRSARLVVFLGFGFHPQNMMLLMLRPGSALRENIVKIIASTVGINEWNRETLEEVVHGALAPGPVPGRRPLLLAWNCYQMLSELKPTIMAVAG